MRRNGILLGRIGPPKGSKNPLWGFLERLPVTLSNESKTMLVAVSLKLRRTLALVVNWLAPSVISLQSPLKRRGVIANENPRNAVTFRGRYDYGPALRQPTQSKLHKRTLATLTVSISTAPPFKARYASF